MTIVRLAAGTGPPESFAKGLDGKRLPGLLVSYYYLQKFQANRHRYHFRDWVMDSGAFSAKNSGKEIDLLRYVEVCKELLAKDNQLTEVFALDVIGNFRGTRKNTETMWAAGVEAIPCFHVGTQWSELASLARDYPKIALGGAVGLSKKAKLDWVGQCFARVWPKWIHGFGMCSESLILGFPFASVDATNWELGPCAFGRWKTFGNLSVRDGKNQNLSAEVRHYLDIEARAGVRWKREMTLVGGGPAVRLANIGTNRTWSNP